MTASIPIIVLCVLLNQLGVNLFVGCSIVCLAEFCACLRAFVLRPAVF